MLNLHVAHKSVPTGMGGGWASGERMEPESIYTLMLCAWEHGMRRILATEGPRTILLPPIFGDMQGWRDKRNSMERQDRARRGRPRCRDC